MAVQYSAIVAHVCSVWIIVLDALSYGVHIFLHQELTGSHITG
jgi:hypothetical protein